MTRYYIALGSNMGDRQAYLQAGVRGMHTLGMRVVAVSSLYETDPWGNTEQAPFLNAVVAVDSLLSPHGVLYRLQAIEDHCGRVRTARWGPRTLDLDLVYADGVCRHDAALTLPHPYFWERGFVLVPLAEIAPHVVHHGENVRLRARHLSSGVHWLASRWCALSDI